MANLDEIYNVESRTAAFEDHQDGLLVSLAGPGTGKTYSLLKRIAALTARGESPESVCYITFIREISKAFAADYIDEFGREFFEQARPRISTLHSFACRVLRNQGFRINFDEDLYFTNVADKVDDAANTLNSDILAFLDPSICRTPAQLRGKLEEIKNAWRQRVDPESLAGPMREILSQALSLFRVYRVIDWDQTIPLSDQLLRDAETVPAWIEAIEHYLVDEFQDFNPAEQTLIELLAESARSIVVVGDDDQSLYGGRGGSPAGMRSLYERTNVDKVSLAKSYRCKASIVVAANTFQATMRQDPRPLVPYQDGGEVQCFKFKSSKAEQVFLTEFLSTCIDEMPDEPRAKDGIICLFPSWKVLNAYFGTLEESVPCIKRKRAPDETRLWLTRILHFIQRPHQRFLQRLLLTRFTDVKPRHQKLIVKRVLERDEAPLPVVESLLADDLLSGTAAVAAREFCDFCSVVQSQDPTSISESVAALLQAPQDPLLDSISEFIARRDEADEDEAISQVCDLVLPDTAEPPEDLGKILFLTMHGSKGLTRRTVVMPGLERAWLPGDAKGEKLAERRRLFYVALTRATDNVVITFPARRASKDSLNFPIEGRGEGSTFVADAGLRFVYHP